MLSTQQIKQRLSNILSPAPELLSILNSDIKTEKKRIEIRKLLSSMMDATYEENPDIAPLEYLLTRNAIAILRKTLSHRSEELAGYSLLQYIIDLLTMPSYRNLDRPTSAFLAELDHLIRGIAGKTGVYETKKPAYTRYRGRKAANLRSSDLSNLAKEATRHMDKYRCGLESDVVRRRSRNKMRILTHFNATDLEWEKWQWHSRHIVRDADTLKNMVRLTEEENEAIKMARENRIPFGITPYYVSLMDYECGGRRDKAVRAQVIPSIDYVQQMAQARSNKDISMDYMLEHDTSPIDGITRRYPNIVILKPVLTCPQICVYCQRNWEIEDVLSNQAVLNSSKLDKALDWISKTEEINEVLITGGDPLLLSNNRLSSIISRLASMQHVIRIRIGTRCLVTLPQRVTESLVRNVGRFHIPGKREIIIITHFEHPYEITPQSIQAVQKFRRNGMEVYNQQVYTYYNARKFESALLRQKLRLIGVTPYYTFNTKGKDETNDFRVPIARLIQEQKEESRLMPGTVRTDRIVFNVPGLGKNDLNAYQHHDVISFLPDGRRVYEFHPWEKKLSLADTYVYRDVPIYNFLKRLKADGEDARDYRSIWYYY